MPTTSTSTVEVVEPNFAVHDRDADGAVERRRIEAVDVLAPGQRPHDRLDMRGVRRGHEVDRQAFAIGTGPAFKNLADHDAFDTIDKLSRVIPVES